MNLRVYFAKDKLKSTIDCMMFTRTKEELDVLFGNAIEEFLEYQRELKTDIEERKK